MSTEALQPVHDVEVAYTGPARVEVPDVGAREVEVELLGGRHRWSVGGRIAEGPRWWRGELAVDAAELDLRAGTQVTVVLDDRAAVAVVEATATATGVAVRGIEPPPFAVP